MSAPKQPMLTPPRGGIDIGDYTLRDFAAKWMFQQCDLPQYDHYRAANAALDLDGDDRERIVFMGDSITEFWPTLKDLGGDAWRSVNRGIAGQNAAQMLLRFGDDVIDLRPGLAVILCGTNDMRTYVGEPALAGAGAFDAIRRSVTAMADIAMANGVKLILATLPPVGRDPNTHRDPSAIRRANTWIKHFADQRALGLADYCSALADQDGLLPPDLSVDGVHPNTAGYARMMTPLAAALDRAGYQITRSAIQS